MSTQLMYGTLPSVLSLFVAIFVTLDATTSVAQTFPSPPIEIGGVPDCPYESLGPFDGLYFVSLASCPPPYPASYAMTLMINAPINGACIDGNCSFPLGLKAAAAAAQQAATIDEAISAVEKLKNRFNEAYKKPLPSSLQKIVQKTAFSGTYLDKWRTYLNDASQPDRLQNFNNEFPLAQLEYSAEVSEGIHLPLKNSAYVSLPDRKIQVNLGSPVLKTEKAVIQSWLVRIETEAGPKYFKVLWLEATTSPGTSPTKRRAMVGYQVKQPPQDTPVIIGTFDSENAYSHQGKFPVAGQMLNFAAISVDEL